MSGTRLKNKEIIENSETVGKQLFRQAWNISQHLDISIKQIRNCNDLFHDELIGLRKHLRDKCEQIILLDCSQRRKAEELLWKKVFYDVIQKCRQQRMQLLNDEHTLRYWLDHLSVATDYYSKLISKMEVHYGLEVSRLDASSFDVLQLNDVTVDWLKGLFYRSFIYLGDIARYQQDITEGSLQAAISAYHNAMMLDPTKGTVFNQMAALLPDKNYSIDAVYYYMRSLSSPEPFTGAESNLKQIYDKNAKRLEVFITEFEGRTSEDGLKEFVYQRLLLNFINLHSVLSNSSSKTGNSDVPAIIQQLESDMTECLSFNLQLLQEVLLHKSVDDVSSLISIEAGVQMLLPCELLLKLVAMTILSSHSLRLQGSSQTLHITKLVLSLCSSTFKYIHDHLWLLLMHRVKQPCCVGKTFLHYMLPETVSATVVKSGHTAENRQTKTKRRRFKGKKIDRRRRKVSNISSSESESEENGVTAGSNGSSSDDSLACEFAENLSEQETTVDLLESLSDSSDKEPTQSHPTNSPFQKGRRQIVLAANFSLDHTPQVVSHMKMSSDEASCEKNEKEICEGVRKMCGLLVQEDCFVMVKIFSDWLQTYPAVIATCAQSVPQLWSHLAQLLNALPTEAQLLSAGLTDASLCNGVQVVSLVEDVALRGFAPFVRCQETINYALPSLNGFEQAVTRLSRFHRLGQYLSNLKTATAFSWNGRCYVGPAQKQAQEADLRALEKQKEETQANLRQSNLMKTMAHLRLQTEVAALQQVQTSTLFTPYLVPDASTLSKSLHFIKKLLKTEQFIVVIASAVIEVLDSMKKGKENYAVRDTIKFLERELKLGNKFLHAQKAQETRHIYKKLPKQDLLSWQLQSLLGCAVYFNTQQQEQATTVQTMVTVLLDQSLIDSLQGGQLEDEHQQKMLEMITTALQYGLDTDTAALFYDKWRHSRQSS